MSNAAKDESSLWKQIFAIVSAFLITSIVLAPTALAICSVQSNPILSILCLLSTLVAAWFAAPCLILVLGVYCNVTWPNDEQKLLTFRKIGVTVLNLIRNDFWRDHLLSDYGSALIQEGRLEEALSAKREALQVFLRRPIKNNDSALHRQTIYQANVGNVLYMLHRYEESSEYLHKSKQLMDSMQSPSTALRWFIDYSVATIELEFGKLESAQALINSAFDAVDKLGLPEQGMSPQEHMLVNLNYLLQLMKNDDVALSACDEKFWNYLWTTSNEIQVLQLHRLISISRELERHQKRRKEEKVLKAAYGCAVKHKSHHDSQLVFQLYSKLLSDTGRENEAEAVKQHLTGLDS